MLKIAVIGAGAWGPNLIRNFHNLQQSEVLWVADRDTRRLEHVQRRFPTIAVGADPAEALQDPRVDAVVIATPTTTHYALVKAALESRKHVLVEKPITDNVAQAEELT